MMSVNRIDVGRWSDAWVRKLLSSFSPSVTRDVASTPEVFVCDDANEHGDR
jgi:hypothetical protein